ncbi:NAD(P)-dependent oxidoreductase [Frankia sp. QA3]|uniref:NAD(P)-dependent oxidoreductase n=1 Tax=Frankia sp. QA3 TaxID=710111 RepID=UPI0012F727F6|nr:NAD(P)-dependent oxidoreductase [Frankia sp. QA3]
MTGSDLVTPAAMEYLESQGHTVRHVRSDDLAEAELHRALIGAAGYIIGGNEAVSAEHIIRAHELEVLAWTGVDYASRVPGWRTASDHGIAVVYTPGANAPAVAEFTMLLTLAMLRPFTTRIAGGPTPTIVPPAGRELATRMLGVIGLGRIGSRVASIASNGFGMQVCYSTPRRDRPAEELFGVEYRPRSALMAESDVITLHRPGLLPGEPPEIGALELSLMKNDAVIVNTGSPELVDLEALVGAMRDKNISVAFDGIGSGPSWDHLVALGPDRFLAVPEMGFSSRESNDRVSSNVVRDVSAVLNGTQPDSVANPDFRAVRRHLRP